MVKSVKLRQLAKITIVLSVHIGTNFSVQVMLMFAHKELNGQEVTAKQSKRNVKLVNIGVETTVQLFQVNVPNNLFGMILKIDVSQSIIFVQVELTLTDILAYLTPNAKIIKFGVTHWLNVSVLTIHSGMETHVLLVLEE